MICGHGPIAEQVRNSRPAVSLQCLGKGNERSATTTGGRVKQGPYHGPAIFQKLDTFRDDFAAPAAASDLGGVVEFVGFLGVARIWSGSRSRLQPVARGFEGLVPRRRARVKQGGPGGVDVRESLASTVAPSAGVEAVLVRVELLRIMTARNKMLDCGDAPPFRAAESKVGIVHKTEGAGKAKLPPQARAIPSVSAFPARLRRRMPADQLVCPGTCDGRKDSPSVERRGVRGSAVTHAVQLCSRRSPTRARLSMLSRAARSVRSASSVSNARERRRRASICLASSS